MNDLQERDMLIALNRCVNALKLYLEIYAGDTKPTLLQEVSVMNAARAAIEKAEKI